MATALAAALATAAVDMPAVASVDDAQRLAGPGDYWDAFGQIVASALTPALERGAAIGVDEAQHVDTFKLAKVDIQTAGQGGAAALGINWDLVNTQARDWASAYSAQLVRRIADVTRARIQAAVTSFIDTSEDIPDLARRIRKIIDDPRRALLIAQTESTRSFAEGNTLAWTAQGIQGRKWFNVEDSLVCPICRHLGGQVAKLGQPFKGPDGQDIDNPPGHPGCRCYVQPVEVVANKPAKPKTPKPAPGPVVATPAPVAAVMPPAPGPTLPPPIGPTVPGTGPKVSAALRFNGSQAQAMADAIALIDRVHSDGELVPIWGDTRPLGKTTYGEYHYSDVSEDPNGKEIHISPTAPHALATMLHETGHYLDNVALRGKNADGQPQIFGSLSTDSAGLLRAIDGSNQNQMLNRMAGQDTVTITLADGSTTTSPPHKDYIDYLQNPREQFARAYTQYIAVKSQDPTALKQLDTMRNNPRNPYPTQWSDEDFQPIQAQFDAWFKAKGWLKDG